MHNFASNKTAYHPTNVIVAFNPQTENRLNDFYTSGTINCPEQDDKRHQCSMRRKQIVALPFAKLRHSFPAQLLSLI